MSWLKDNFHTNKAQRIGLMVLISLIFLLTVVNFTIGYFIPPAKNYDHVLDTVTFVDLEIPKKFKKPTPKKYFKKDNPPKKITATKAKTYPANKKPTYVKKVRFTFDPNKTSRDSLILLGIKPYVADNIIKYRNKGGQFYRPADLEKIYGIDKKLAQDLKTYVSIPKKVFSNHKKTYSKETTKKQVSKVGKPSNEEKPKEVSFKKETPKFDKIVNLNKATKADLVEVPGIGKYYADQIIKLREEVGGLHSVDQLLSIYSLSKQRLEKFKQYLSVDNSYTKININTADQKTLANHKYIDWKTAKIIVNYRKNHGAYKNVDDLKKIKIIDVNWLEKVKPYLSY